ncbi:hypothetical protein [Adhaeretor mobilis]|uniref:Uncharacterized protein n=1 Tax=Adhaeretor mobilis TaxID=1930276 RepID=A0A517MZ32_9BACT|nr:hypothetical protein [Adhaeretor mobilis]QDT00143.1 hypothetical protein HG15A2_34780 [Adhaeretor mobilis]
MLHASSKACFVALAALTVCSAGCQAWLGSSPLPSKSGREMEQIEKLASQDPFPSPQDVGISDSSTERR